MRRLSAADLQARVLHRDGLMLVIDKPAGIAVHAGPGGGPNLEALFDALRFGWAKPPALAHRLDRDTSGCLVLGRHPKALRRLGALFASGRIEKTYWAVVHGAPPDAEGTIDRPLRKTSRRDGGWRMLADPSGQKAVTGWRVRGRGGDLTWLELRPRTGRTHQVRVHCALLGCPIVGDPLYGPLPPDGTVLPPLHLHARALAIPLKDGKPPVVVEAPPPPHMLAALGACGFGLAPPAGTAT
jgi:tRNA pseudouridine32 synthase/23S rRNA pseudouridine746 synthase/23S rRNA pseudouridine1911/1915/1917 synthase